MTRRLPPPRARWRCITCGQLFATYGRWEAHADQAGHHRGEALTHPGQAITADLGPSPTVPEGSEGGEGCHS